MVYNFTPIYSQPQVYYYTYPKLSRIIHPFVEALPITSPPSSDDCDPRSSDNRRSRIAYEPRGTVIGKVYANGK